MPRRVLAVSSAGSVFLGVQALVERLQAVEVRWIAVCMTDTASALADADVRWTPELTASRPWQVGAATWRAWRELRAFRPDVVIAAGTGVALPWLVAARIAGVRTVWVEPIARVELGNARARACARLVDCVIVQRAGGLRSRRRAIFSGRLGADDMTALLDQTLAVSDDASNPFAHHPTRRWSFAFDALRRCDGVHLDVGVGDGEFLTELRRSGRDAIGVDVHAGYLAELRRQGDAPLVRIGHRDAWPFRDNSVASVSMLDTLEHVADESIALAEAFRVLAHGGTLVVTVPARHAFSFLDPDNAKLRYPNVHRIAYTARRGSQRYERRFGDLSDGLRGDLSVERDEHTNYLAPELISELQRNGFSVLRRDGANLFWRFFQVPQLLTRGRLSQAFDAPLRWDGEHFHQANLFLVAKKD